MHNFIVDALCSNTDGFLDKNRKTGLMIDRFPTQNPRAMTVCYFFFHEKVVIHDIRRKKSELAGDQRCIDNEAVMYHIR